MRGLNGAVLASRLKELASCAPIIMVSGEDQLPPEAVGSIDKFMNKGENPATFLNYLLADRPVVPCPVLFLRARASKCTSKVCLVIALMTGQKIDVSPK